MSLITVIVVLVIVGVILYLIQKYVPMDATIKKIIMIVAIVAVCFWLLSLFGLLPNLGAIKVGG
jgi:hypothetical protein